MKSELYDSDSESFLAIGVLWCQLVERVGRLASVQDATCILGVEGYRVQLNEVFSIALPSIDENNRVGRVTLEERVAL